MSARAHATAGHRRPVVAASPGHGQPRPPAAAPRAPGSVETLLRYFQSVPRRSDRTARRHPGVDGIWNTVHPWHPARPRRAQLKPSLVHRRHQGASPSCILPTAGMVAVLEHCRRRGPTETAGRARRDGMSRKRGADIALTSRRRSAPLRTLASPRSCSSSEIPRRARGRSQERDTAGTWTQVEEADVAGRTARTAVPAAWTCSNQTSGECHVLIHIDINNRHIIHLKNIKLVVPVRAPQHAQD